MKGNREIADALKSAKWKPSDRGNHHEYILELDYLKLVHKVKAIIDKEGMNEKYHGYTVRYWFHKGYRYWVMLGISGMPKTLVLNRAPQRGVR